MEFALWRTKHLKMHSKDYCTEYLKHGQPSKPVEEFEDRLKLYGPKALLMYSATTPGHITRLRAFEDMKDLLQKYLSRESVSNSKIVFGIEGSLKLPPMKHEPEVSDIIMDLNEKPETHQDERSITKLEANGSRIT
ncbi:hypothetical protein MMC18_001831 [Xylographa bjoerkii]|nr:hypothetical protein [Xylographa bjoerkii]